MACFLLLFLPSAGPGGTAGADPPPETGNYGWPAVGAGAPTHPDDRAARVVLNLFIRTSSSSCWPKLGEYVSGRSVGAVRSQSRPPDHGETAVERRLRLVAGDAALQGGLVRLDDPRQRVSSEWIVPTPLAEGVR